MDSMCIGVAIMGGLVESKPFWFTLLRSVRGPVDLYIVDNTGYDEHQAEFFTYFIQPYWPGHITIDVKESNVGVIQAMQDTYKSTDHGILCFIHNDLYMGSYGWDREVREFFVEKWGFSDAGLVSFFGALGIAKNTGRYNVFNNMLEAEKHGARYTHPHEIAVLDGLSIIASRKMLDARDGFDTDYDTHHFYDLDISLESIDRGFKNYYLPIPVHHQSGVTACRPVFQDWANKYIEGGERTLYEKNKARFITKWEKYLPWEVGQEWKKGE